ncbi:hypothetical protein C0991_002267 [Blastosporella zonata]|nr:hypothetical protein C0991_002267 [Blastosporella zonata]
MFVLIAALALLSGVNAHFRLLYPEPRGVFVANQEPNFCGGYTEALPNRTVFPLSGGFFSITTGHSDWTAGVLLSTAQNPTSFDNFSSNGVQQVVGPYAKEGAAGTFCIPLNISAAGIDGLKDGSNVTIQVVFAGGDGNLYQCADLTLSSNFAIPSNVTCKNGSVTTTAASSTGTSVSPIQTAGALGATHIMAVLALATAVNAHFQLQFPTPRGVFNEDNEPNFCDGYLTPASNRTTFPLSGGFLSLNSEHPQFTTGVLLSTAADPTSFNNFTQVVPYFQTEGEGSFCFQLDFNSFTNTTASFQNGENVTIQIVFDGGDGQLYQCADLTLSDDATIPSDVKCTNATGSTTSTTASTGSSTAAPASTTSSGAIGKVASAGIAGLVLSAVGAGLFAL